MPGHSSEWIVRPRRRHRGKPRPRPQTGIDDLWPFTGEMFQVDDGERALIDAGIAVDPATLHFAVAERRFCQFVGEATAGAAEKRLDAAGRPQRPAQRASRAPAQRIAVDATDVFRVRHGDRWCSTMICGSARGDAAAAVGRSGNPGSDHRRSRRAPRRRDQRRPASRSRSRRPIPDAPR